MPTTYRILFLGTPEFARHHLECLLQQPRVQVVGVVTQPARPQGRKLKAQCSPVELLAQQHQLPVVATPKVNQCLDKVKQLKAQAAVVVAFGQLLSAEFLQLFEHQVFNIHASLLPRWRGAAPIQAALAAGDTETGVCLQQLVQKMDAGPVLGVRRLQLKGHETAVQVHDKLKLLGPELLAHELVEFLDGRLSSKTQNEKLVTLAPKLQKTQSFINWSHTASQIYNQLRAWAMNGGISCSWPPEKISPHTKDHPHTKDNSSAKQNAVYQTDLNLAHPWTENLHTKQNVAKPAQRLKIWHAQVLDESIVSPFRPGEVFFVGPDFFLVACGRGVLKVLQVQLPSKKPMPVEEFLKGHPLKPGFKL